MPVIKSAIKKLRKDIKRTKANDVFRNELDRALRTAKKSPSAKSVSGAVSAVDRAVKKNLMHKNRAAHIKSSLSKLAKPGTKAKSPVKTAPKAVKSASKAKPAVKSTTTVKKPASKAAKSAKK